MSLSKVGLAILVQKALEGQTDPEENRVVAKELTKKFEKEGLETFKERAVLSSFILFPKNKSAREDFMREQMERCGKLVNSR